MTTVIKTKLKVLIVFVIFAFALSIVSNTYSRYVAAAEGNIDLALANWQILLNDEDITTHAKKEDAKKEPPKAAKADPTKTSKKNFVLF